jgi:hypothetical protein
MRDWLEKNEPYIRLAYRIAILGAILWLGSLIRHADPSWALSDIRDWLELISRLLRQR